MRDWTIPGLLLLCCLAVAAAHAQEAPEITSREAPATFSTKVNLVSVPVVVRDSKGRAIGDLRQEDFRLFDKGKQQVIARFSVLQNTLPASPTTIAAGAPSAVSPSPWCASCPDQYVAYIFDDIHLKFEQIAQIRAAAEKHFAEKLDPKSRAAIFTTSGRINLEFTDDRAKLHETLLRINVGPNALPNPPKESNLGARPTHALRTSTSILPTRRSTRRIPIQSAPPKPPPSPATGQTPTLRRLASWLPNRF